MAFSFGVCVSTWPSFKDSGDWTDSTLILNEHGLVFTILHEQGPYLEIASCSGAPGESNLERMLPLYINIQTVHILIISLTAPELHSLDDKSSIKRNKGKGRDHKKKRLDTQTLLKHVD